ncbi:MAG: hypothetical protein ACFCD0_25635 [Gemmataceae bacterium]
MQPLRANPGGQIAPENVVGRDKLIAEIWETLETRSVNLTAERRIGKTTIIRKMCEQPREKWIPVFQDLERIQTASEFAKDVYEKTVEKLTGWKKFFKRAKELYEMVAGIKMGKVELPKLPQKPWKALLEASVEELVAHQSPHQIVFFWDEVPYMIDKICKTDGEPTAKELLDVLRALRQQHSGFKMVVTGSIGLHHVLTTLKKGGYKNEPFNDMTKIDVEPLDPGHGAELAASLIAGERLEPSDTEKAAKHISKQADHFPF